MAVLDEKFGSSIVHCRIVPAGIRSRAAADCANTPQKKQNARVTTGSFRGMAPPGKNSWSAPHSSHYRAEPDYSTSQPGLERGKKALRTTGEARLLPGFLPQPPMILWSRWLDLLLKNRSVAKPQKTRRFISNRWSGCLHLGCLRSKVGEESFARRGGGKNYDGCLRQFECRRKRITRADLS